MIFFIVEFVLSYVLALEPMLAANVQDAVFLVSIYDITKYVTNNYYVRLE